MKRVKEKTQMKQLAEEIRKNLALYNGEKIGDLANAVGVSRMTYYRYLRDMSKMPLGVLVFTMKYLEMDALQIQPRL